MTTIRQVKEVVKPLLARNPDLTLVGRRLVVRPVRHLWRGISIGRTSTAEDFRLLWGVLPLFEPDVIIGFTWGDIIFNPSGGPWLADDPNVSANMCDAIERNILPLLRPLQTIADFVGFATKERFPWSPLASHRRQRLFVELALGDFSSARPICAFCETQGRLPYKYLLAWERDFDIFVTEKVSPLLASEDKVGIARLLHDLEAKAVAKEKLDPFWQPSPFPIETA